MTVEARMLAGARVAVLTAWPSDSPPVRYKGRIWIRVGPRRAHATAQDERILNEKRRHRDPHFDAQPVPTASIADLDLRRFEEDYLPQAVDAAALAENDRSTEASVDGSKPAICGHRKTGHFRRPRRALIFTSGPPVFARSSGPWCASSAARTSARARDGGGGPAAR